MNQIVYCVSWSNGGAGYELDKVFSKKEEADEYVKQFNNNDFIIEERALN